MYRREDFTCECGCGKAGIQEDLFLACNILADRLKDPPRIARGFYCEKFRNRDPGYEASLHCEGKAVDFHVFGQYFRHKFLAEAFQLFGLIVIYPRFVHVELVSPYGGNVCLVM